MRADLHCRSRQHEQHGGAAMPHRVSVFLPMTVTLPDAALSPPSLAERI
jgi:hypothetical protein